MLSSDNILTIGPEYQSPKGCVAQCVHTYSKTVYSDFLAIANSCEGSKAKKLYFAIVGLVRMFFTLLFNRKIKIVHIHTASYISFKRSSYFVQVAKAMKKKVVLHIHGGGFKEYYAKEKGFVDSVFDKTDAIITLSESWKDFFQNEVGFKNTCVVPNIIENPTKMDVEKDGKFHLLYMGHIYKAKGIFDLVEMVNDNHEHYRGKMILDIGGGMYDVEVLKSFVRDNQLEDVIHFHGWVSGSKKYELLNLADAFILPSYTEGVPISILEAMSYGLPIISTPVGGIPEILHDGENGYMVEPGDKMAIKKAINKLVDNPSICKEMGVIGKGMVKANLPEGVKHQIFELYDVVLCNAMNTNTLRGGVECRTIYLSIRAMQNNLILKAA